jgi:hypothetical protein
MAQLVLALAPQRFQQEDKMARLIGDSLKASLKERTRRSKLALILLAGVVLLIGTAWHSAAKLRPMPADAPPAAYISRRGDNRAEIQGASASTFAPFLDIVPSSDGTDLYISAQGTGKLGGTVFANVGIGPGHDKGGWTMSFSDTLESYVTTVSGLDPADIPEGTVSITTTLGLNTGDTDFARSFAPASSAGSMFTADGGLTLSWLNSDTFPSDTYVAIASSYGPPGPAPAGCRIIASRIYSIRASGALTSTNRPVILEFDYAQIFTLADPHTLAIFAWDAFNKHWDKLEGTLSTQGQYLSVVTSRFTTYALMATSAWDDEFDDLTGLDSPHDVDNITQGPLDSSTLILASTPASGSAVSVPITPTSGFVNWDSLTFSGAADPPTTTLTVDILSPDGSEVLTDVASGTELSGLISSAQYPSLRLRVAMASTTAGETPSLDDWQLSWQVGEHRIYLPLVRK